MYPKTRRYLHLLCADVPDVQRFSRVDACVHDQGIALQYAVFLLNISIFDLLLLLNKLQNIIDENEDDIRVYPISCEKECVIFGLNKLDACWE